MAINFYDEARGQSRVKAAIVSKYFEAWANVIIGAQKKHEGDRIAYIDLFAGRGRYEDGTPSTPLLVLEKAIQQPIICDRLLTLFNDKDQSFARSLQEAINTLPGISSLRYPPRVETHEVGTEIVKQFEQMKLVPTLSFVDPWGYKGLSLQLVKALTKDWACDCIFFFNYNRINAALENVSVKEHMDSLFGPERAEQLRARLEVLLPDEREMVIVEELCQALKALGRRYVPLQRRERHENEPPFDIRQ